jgi:flagellar M-ring protein FliF
MDQLLKFINNLNSAQRAVVIGGFSLLFVFLIGLLVYSNIKAQDEKLNYTIASNLTKSQVMLASSELENAGIPFSIIGTGNNLTLKTNKNYINVAKIKLVTSEAATSKHTGWEIFEKSSLGTTNFENKIKYLRALEGELSRSLESLSGVLRATVKIAFPKDTIFTQRKTLPTASAVLTLKPGVFLTQKQIDGIKNFIASAVPKLKSENINLIDQDGSILEKTPNDVNAAKFGLQHKYKNKLEKGFEEKIIALMEPFVGKGRVVARVSVDLDFTKQDIEQEIFEPEGTIRSQQTTESTSSSKSAAGSAGGQAGVVPNITPPNGNGGNGGNNTTSEEAKNITNYEISKKIIKQKDDAFATVKKISAAVTFDSGVLKDVQNKDEFLSSMLSIVEDTVGFDPKRGDKVTIKDFKFLGFEQQVDKDGKPINVGTTTATVADDGTDSMAMIQSILRDFGEYIQYLIAPILLFVFYKKFIVNHEVVILGDKAVSSASPEVDEDGIALTDYEHEFDVGTAHGRLKAKVKSQIMNNISGLDEEDAAKYEVLIEQLDKEINDNPDQIAEMIEMLLGEGDSNFKTPPKKS